MWIMMDWTQIWECLVWGSIGLGFVPIGNIPCRCGLDQFLKNEGMGQPNSLSVVRCFA